jgi:hypothetical protein
VLLAESEIDQLGAAAGAAGVIASFEAGPQMALEVGEQLLAVGPLSI